jgi:hypothetical protein
MKRILSERNLVVILFLAALTVFSFAREDAKKFEKISQDSKASSLLSAPQKTASASEIQKKTEQTVSVSR